MDFKAKAVLLFMQLRTKEMQGVGWDALQAIIEEELSRAYDEGYNNGMMVGRQINMPPPQFGPGT